MKILMFILTPFIWITAGVAPIMDTTYFFEIRW